MTDLHAEATRQHVNAPDRDALQRALARHEHRATLRKRGEVAKLAELEAEHARLDAADGFDLAEDLDVVRLDASECCEVHGCDCAAHVRTDSNASDDYQRGAEAARQRNESRPMKPIRSIDPAKYQHLIDHPDRLDAAIEADVRRGRGGDDADQARADADVRFRIASALPFDDQGNPTAPRDAAEQRRLDVAVAREREYQDRSAFVTAQRAASPAVRLDEAWTDPDGVEISEDEKKRRRAAAKASTLDAVELARRSETHWNLEATLPFDMPPHERARAHRDADAARERTRRTPDDAA